ncbi:MAG: DNA-methyltransferase [Candidatus Hodarchaeota archaeon]
MKALRDGNQTMFYSSSENMEEIENDSINVILTSPPYNVGKDYSAKNEKYNDKKNYSDYLSFLTQVFKECYRVLSEEGIFFLNIGDSAKDQGKSEDVVRCAVSAGFKRLQTIIWVKSIFGKGHYTPSGGTRRLNNVWEFIFVLIKSKKYQIDPKAIGIPYSDKSNIGRYSIVDLRDAGDVWFIPYSKTTGTTVKKGHEAPFPVQLPLRCLQLVPHAKTVLDPFAGTGSTLRAAKELGLVGYGYEMLPREDVIQKRLNEPITEYRTPLLPQLEFYAETITSLLDKALELLSVEQTNELINILKTTSKRKFQWSCQDLELEPAILKLILEKSNRKIENDKQKSLLGYI